jgi:hypothetical protein
MQFTSSSSFIFTKACVLVPHHRFHTPMIEDIQDKIGNRLTVKHGAG